MINQNELIKGTLNFVKQYKRLPYYIDDDIEVEKLNETNNEYELKPFRATKYIKEFYGTHDKFIDYILTESIITYEEISEYTNVEIKRIKELLTGKVDKVGVRERRAIHNFFGKNYYKHLGVVCDYCKDCTNNKKCGQDYWVTVVICPKYKQKK